MPRNKDHEKNRLKKARLKKLSLFPKNTKLKRPSDPEQAKEWLRNVADHLSSFENAGPGYRFVAYAIKKNLRTGKPQDLGKELGLVYSAGHPRTFHERMTEQDRARKTHNLLRDGQTKSQIASQLNVDLRSLARTYKKYLPRFEKEEQMAPLDRAVRDVLRERPKTS